MPADATFATETPKSSPPESNVKETIESILVAFILAFIFCAFVVEAFVIPTGSMAPTLLGAHMRFDCPDCGYRWDVNYSPPNRDDENIEAFAPLQAGAHPVCPNCGYAISTDFSTRFPVHYGDRILVLKYAYLLQQPQRWDVVVFKSPSEQKPEEAILTGHYTQNYIKRLVGRPGERVMIVDGDVYVGTGDDPEKFRIQRKPKIVQDALWRNVYDNDFIPHGLDGKWQQPWKAEGKGWNLHEGTQTARVFDFGDASGSGILTFDPQANSRDRSTYPLTDWLAYDELDPRSAGRYSVGDLQISCDYERSDGSGALTLTLTRDRDTFTAELTPGAARLVWKDAAGNVTSNPKADVPELRGRGPVRVEFANVDYRVTLCLNGREVISTEDAYQPDLPKLLQQSAPQQAAVRISAEQQQCKLSHLKLARDVYYQNFDGGLANPPGRGNTIVSLGPEEYFVLGDNSAISGDARTWSAEKDRVVLPDENLDVAPGRVPGRFMLGKAFFVYWPAGYRPWNGAPFGIIPNFGDMRFIH